MGPMTTSVRDRFAPREGRTEGIAGMSGILVAPLVGRACR